jgi:murein DD-endopeptidase MepM/ murein hydrolase activator NlpD
MTNRPVKGESNIERQASRFVSALQERISLPVVFLLILAVGSWAGFSLYLKNLELKKKYAGYEADMHLTELQSLRMSNEWLKNRIAVLQEEKAVLLDTAVADLDNKSRVIESILNLVGVDIKIQESSKNSGGPFTSSVGNTGDELIMRTDQYLDTIQNVPLGPPVPGVITSRFGWRNDPINGKKAYHRGVDIRGMRGTDVKATADGEVKIENYTKGDGYYILIDHGNGFVTKYAHMQKNFVKRVILWKGDRLSVWLAAPAEVQDPMYITRFTITTRS